MEKTSTSQCEEPVQDLDRSTAGALEVARSSDPFRGILKKAASLRQGYGRQASCVLGLAGRPF